MHYGMDTRHQIWGPKVRVQGRGETERWGRSHRGFWNSGSVQFNIMIFILTLFDKVLKVFVLIIAKN